MQIFLGAFNQQICQIKMSIGAWLLFTSNKGVFKYYLREMSQLLEPQHQQPLCLRCQDRLNSPLTYWRNSSMDSAILKTFHAF